jgi:hypothetical protein
MAFNENSNHHQKEKNNSNSNVRQGKDLREQLLVVYQESLTDYNISTLSLGDRSYILDLASQKQNRDKQRKEEALDESRTLYNIALEEGAPGSAESLFPKIFTLVQKQLEQEYKEKDRLQDERLKEALEAELERQQPKNNYSQAQGGQRRSNRDSELVEPLDQQIVQEECNMLKKKLRKVERLMNEVSIENQGEITKKYMRLQEKHSEYVAALEEMEEIEEMGDTLSDISSLGSGTLQNENSSKVGPSELLKVKTTTRSSVTTNASQNSKPSEKARAKAKSTASASATTITTATTATTEEKESLPNGRAAAAAKSLETPSSACSQQQQQRYYTLKDFCNGNVPKEETDILANWELHLSPQEFEQHFGMSKDKFDKLPSWKRADGKRKLRTW